MFPRSWCRQQMDEVGVKSAEARGRSPSACAMLASFVKSIRVIRYDIENLAELSQRVGETTKADIGKGVLSEQVHVTRVEPSAWLKIIRSGPTDLAFARHRPEMRDLAVIR